MSEDTVALVVVAYRDPEALIRMLSPFVSELELEIVVVNVTADAAVSRVLSSFAAREVLTMTNVGFGAAVNLGVAATSSDVVVIANDDLELSMGTVRKLAGAAAARGVAVPKLVRPDGRQSPSLRPLATPRTLLIEWALLPDEPVFGLGWLPIDKWRRPKVASKVPAATAAIVAVRALVVRRYPFPENYFLYWEEMEWFWTLRDAGIETWFVPSAVAVRRDGAAVLSPQKAQLMARNAVRVIRQTQGARAAAIAWPVVVMWSIRLALVDVVRYLLTGTGRDRVRARLAGVRAAMAAVSEAS